MVSMVFKVPSHLIPRCVGPWWEEGQGLQEEGLQDSCCGAEMEFLGETSTKTRLQQRFPLPTPAGIICKLYSFGLFS